MCKEERNLSWDKISREELKELSYNRHWADSMIAKQFGVSVSRVRYKRKKLGLTRADITYEHYVCGDQKFINNLNQNALEWFLDESNIDLSAKSITKYIFRNGPVENLHSNGKLTQADMKTLNVFMVNQISGLLQCALNGEWMRLSALIKEYGDSVSEWQDAEPDLTVIGKYVIPLEAIDEKILLTLKTICRKS